MAKKEKKPSRFKEIHAENRLGIQTKILVDRETGINYLWHTEGYGGGLTVLLNADGTPVITPKSQLMEE